MALETGTYISDLVSTNPTASDPKSQGDDHLRLIKSTVKATFPNVSGAVTPTHTELNYVDGVTSAIQTQIDSKGAIAGQTWTGTHVLPSTTTIGTVVPAEISYLSGVTSAIQTQLNTLTSAKGAISGQTWTGSHDYTGATLTAATQTAGDSSTKVATTAFVGGVAFSAALPSQTGNAGKFVKTNGSVASWEYGGIAQVTTATTATTLTSTPTLLKITPASYGVTVTLPDATTCSVGGPLHCIDNQGAYPVRVCNSAGTLLGFIFAGVVSYICLDDNSTAAGVWAIGNNELVGVSARATPTGYGSGVAACIDLGSSRELILSASAAYAVVYDRSTNTFGSSTLVRSGSLTSYAVLSGVDQVLVVSGQVGSTAMQAVVLSISGTTITVNTAASATLSANLDSFAQEPPVIAAGSSFVVSYKTATPDCQLRAISISGTTVTIGSAVTLSGTQGAYDVLGTQGGAPIFAIGSVVIAGSYVTGTAVYFQPYTVSGSTLTLGTGASRTGAGCTLYKFIDTGSGRLISIHKTSSSLYEGSVLTLSGTTVTLSNVTLWTSTVSAINEAVVVSSSKVLIVGDSTTSNLYLLTDTSGTASAGSVATAMGVSSNYFTAYYVDGTNVYGASDSGTPYRLVGYIDCSGSTPVSYLNSSLSTGATAGFPCPPNNSRYSNATLRKNTSRVYGTKFMYDLQPPQPGSTTQPLLTTMQIKNAVTSIAAMLVHRSGLVFYSFYRGKSESERWALSELNSIVKLECVQ